MSIITLAQALAQCRVDEDDAADPMQDYIDGAEAAAVAYLNRSIYADADALAASQDAKVAALGAANQIYAEAVESAAAITDSEQRRATLELATARLANSRLDCARATHGMVANKAVLSAIRLTLAHLYANREAVVSGASAAAVALPLGAEYLLRPYRRTMTP